MGNSGGNRGKLLGLGLIKYVPKNIFFLGGVFYPGFFLIVVFIRSFFKKHNVFIHCFN